MVSKTRAFALIPAFNEGTVIAEVVRSVKSEFSCIVVVDDCSDDETADIAKDAGAIVLRHSVNLGQGAALQTGFDYCLSQGAQYVVTLDADGQHSVTDAQALLEKLIKVGCDVVLGSRFLGKSINMPPSRRLLIKTACLYTRLETGLKLTDTHNGLRALNRKAVKSIRITQNRMAHASEILELIAVNKLDYREHPVSIAYTEYSLGKGQSAWNAFSILIDLLVKKLRNL